ncbi:MAG TPA: LPS export ABC transporter periplasmic protein LptC [Stellaceae bacterium]|nr:LPS export ABC transporter periplasmic protein LptC [Stellaceae bacterium]
MNALQPGAGLARSAPALAEARPSDRHDTARRNGFGTDPYSLAVALLKRVLPVIGVSLLLLVAAWPRLAPLLESVRLNISGIDLRAARELTMLNPRYAGTDRLNRPFVITAAVGHQLPDRDDLMSLEKPRAVMIVHDGARVVLTAATGIYQSQPQLLDLFDNVVLTHQNGTQFVTQRAHANLADNTAEGHVPIEGHGPSGDIWGQGFRILDKGDTIIFTGRSRAIVRGTEPAKPAAAPPEPPAKVLRTAAAIEAAATAPTNAAGDRAPGDRAPAPAAGGMRAAAAPPAGDHPAAVHHRTMAAHHRARWRHHPVGRARTASAADGSMIRKSEDHAE